jgi:hypothetical protein
LKYEVPWEILNHDSEPAEDLLLPVKRLSGGDNSAPAFQESISEKFSGEDPNDIQA